ncbi:DUF3298 domain-containing protein [Luteimonas sp. SDU101]|uniref:DUF3298 and DUF4163 domain-containing protein n=1 Tax=Luteimonas sp. SDU101 TaxID=3422593 RepID=UPI003EBC3DEE
MKRLLVSILVVCALGGCRREAPAQGTPAAVDPQQPAAQVDPIAEAVVLEDVVETDPRYIIGITWDDDADRYPALARELKAYADAARAEVMQAVDALEPGASAMYDLALEFKVLADTPEVFAVAADGGSYTGGAHGTPLIARFVWLPAEERLLTPAELVPDPDAWREISAYVREQLHAALSLRVDADELEPAERARVMQSAGRMIDEGTAPEPENFAQFEPVNGADGRLAGLRFVFPPYQVGPYSDGVQSVEVPAAVLLPHVAPAYRSLFSIAAPPQ